MLKIELTKHGYMLFDSSEVSQFPGFNVEMTFGIDIPLKETIRKMVVSHVPDSQESIDVIYDPNKLPKNGRAAIQDKITISTPQTSALVSGYDYFYPKGRGVFLHQSYKRKKNLKKCLID